MYKVISFFTDLQDNNHPYNVGDDFPRDGLEVSNERFLELSGNYNAQRRPLIEEVQDAPRRGRKPKSQVEPEE